MDVNRSSLAGSSWNGSYYAYQVKYAYHSVGLSVSWSASWSFCLSVRARLSYFIYAYLSVYQSVCWSVMPVWLCVPVCVRARLSCLILRVRDRVLTLCSTQMYYVIQAILCKSKLIENEEVYTFADKTGVTA